MTTLNQIIAIEKTARSKAADALTRAHSTLQRKDSLFGQIRRYTPRDDDGVVFPAEDKVLETNVDEQLHAFMGDYARALDLTFTKEFANMGATGNLVLPDGTRVEEVPVTYLLHLEKKLVELRAFIKKLPTIDTGVVWHWDEANRRWASEPVETIKGQKVYRNHVRAEATEHHPAQVEVYSEDVPIGTWSTIKLSGAISPVRQDEMIDNIDSIIEAVKKARESANMTEVTDRTLGVDLLRNIFTTATS